MKYQKNRSFLMIFLPHPLEIHGDSRVLMTFLLHPLEVHGDCRVLMLSLHQDISELVYQLQQHRSRDSRLEKKEGRTIGS